MTDDQVAQRIVEIMRELDISHFTVTTWRIEGTEGTAQLHDELRVHFNSDNVEGRGSTANEFEQPAFGLLKELEMLVMGETS